MIITAMSARITRQSAEVSALLSRARSRHSSRQMPIAGQIGGQSGEHEDRRNAEAVLPTVDLREHTAQQRPGDRSEIDPHAEDGEAAGA
jgi:hypothetical protein